MTTQVDFYQLSRDPVEKVVAMLARKVLQAGHKLLIVTKDADSRTALSKALWNAGPAEFLAHGEAGQIGEAQQPILLSDSINTANGATMIILADGQWREEATGFERALLLFGGEQTQAARQLWRAMDGREGITQQIHKQGEDGRWRAGA